MCLSIFFFIACFLNISVIKAKHTYRGAEDDSNYHYAKRKLDAHVQSTPDDVVGEKSFVIVKKGNNGYSESHGADQPINVHMKIRDRRKSDARDDAKAAEYREEARAYKRKYKSKMRAYRKCRRDFKKMQHLIRKYQRLLKKSSRARRQILRAQRKQRGRLRAAYIRMKKYKIVMRRRYILKIRQRMKQLRSRLRGFKRRVRKARAFYRFKIRKRFSQIFHRHKALLEKHLQWRLRFQSIKMHHAFAAIMRHRMFVAHAVWRHRFHHLFLRFRRAVWLRTHHNRIAQVHLYRNVSKRLGMLLSKKYRRRIRFMQKRLANKVRKQRRMYRWVNKLRVQNTRLAQKLASSKYLVRKLKKGGNGNPTGAGVGHDSASPLMMMMLQQLLKNRQQAVLQPRFYPAQPPVQVYPVQVVKKHT